VPVTTACRRTNSDKDSIRPIHSRCQITSERKTPSLHVACQKIFKARLKNRHFAVFKHFDLALIRGSGR